jgi:hypothetical protein
MMTELTIRARHQAEQAYDPWERKHLFDLWHCTVVHLCMELARSQQLLARLRGSA